MSRWVSGRCARKDTRRSQLHTCCYRGRIAQSQWCNMPDHVLPLGRAIHPDPFKRTIIVPRPLLIELRRARQHVPHHSAVEVTPEPLHQGRTGGFKLEETGIIGPRVPNERVVNCDRLQRAPVGLQQAGDDVAIHADVDFDLQSLQRCSLGLGALVAGPCDSR
ncbi:hypothetical protein BO82DRAFT_64884 [Aspergillus uvarum CBS 121591]|uniref:Uncharacterized protein n=1 Tax=Aspergillus uvarum CBS 121591 TaxID=1448315 RepID=A0A319D2V7_9EURO|nr:hypothetical protein BO82DRAFT_64884 [Aspergillus uvarum CBS 121591]PYH82268.1 hypothetical protein BO82DRAFT_64884 [Aspergillus uvarum CBS 121591]